MNENRTQARLKEWEETFAMLREAKEAAKAKLSAHDRAKPADAEPNSPWHRRRRDLSWEVSTCREAIEWAELQIKTLNAIVSRGKGGATDESKRGDVESLIARDPEELSAGERFIRTCVIRRQKNLKEKGARMDPVSKPGRSGGYQVDS